MHRPKGIMLSEINQAERHKYCVISLISGIKKTKQTNTHSTHRKEIRFVVTRGRGREGGNWRRR